MSYPLCVPQAFIRPSGIQALPLPSTLIIINNLDTFWRDARPEIRCSHALLQHGHVGSRIISWTWCQAGLRYKPGLSVRFGKRLGHTKSNLSFWSPARMENLAYEDYY